MNHAPKGIDLGQGIDTFFPEGPDYESGYILTAGSSPAQAKWQTDVDELPPHYLKADERPITWI